MKPCPDCTPPRSTRIRPWNVLPVLLALLLTGCPGRIASPEAFLSAADGSATCDVRRDIFVPKCGGGICHGSEDPAASLDLVSPGLAERVHGVEADPDQPCAGGVLADPFDPEASLLLSKSHATTVVCGDVMPYGANELSESELDCIRQFIVALGDGASNPDAGNPDAGSTPRDAGPFPEPDAGVPAIDAGPPEVDAGPPTSPVGAVVRFVVFDTEARMEGATVEDGATLDRAALPTNYSFAAVTDPSPVGSVSFALDAEPDYHTENSPPYVLNGDRNALDLALESHTITATPHAERDGSGDAGTPLTITFSIE